MSPHARAPAPTRPRWYSKSRLRKMSREEDEIYWREHRGEFIALPVGDGFAFARSVAPANFAFYDLHAAETPALEQIKRSKLLFVLCCSTDSLMRGRWKVIGHEPLEQELAVPDKKFRHPWGSQYVDIYTEGEFRPYAGEDLSKLEPCAVWDDPAQVEERLRRHFNGEPDYLVDRVPRALAERLFREYWATHGKSPAP